MIVDTATYEALVYQRVREEHRAIRAALVLARTGPVGYGNLVRQVRIHDRCEEIVLLPLLAGSHELGRAVRRLRAEHAGIDALLRAGPFDTFAETLLRHLDDEEDILLPGARAVLSDHHAAELVEVWDRERALVETRSGDRV